MKTSRKQLSAGIAAYLCTSICMGTQAFAAEMELDEVIVQANREPMSEMQPYVTGGDQNIITREQIEKKNFSTISEALKTLPGVRISTPGYRGGEYGFGTYNSELTVNGENHIVILVDGKRVDNDASTFSGGKSAVSLSTLPGIDEVETLTLVKGSAAAIYGADAAGGVLSITTRRRGGAPRTTLNLGVGSWGQKKAALTHTGESEDKRVKYTAALSRAFSGDTSYKEYSTGESKKFAGTRWQENHAALSVERVFSKDRSLLLDYRYSYEQAYYPITAPDYRNIDKFYAGTLFEIDQDPASKNYHRYKKGFNSSVPGYRNIFLYDAWLNSNDETQTNNLSLKYKFGKTKDGRESYFRVYKNHSTYRMADYAGLWNVPYPYISEFWEAAQRAGKHTDTETVTGAVLQLAKDYGMHGLTGGISFRKSEYTQTARNFVETTRNQWGIYAQDKLRLSDKFTLTPGVNLTQYAAMETNGAKTADSVSRATFSLYGSYDYAKAGNLYFSASQIFRPVTGADHSRQLIVDPLENEKGWSYAIGVHQDFSPRDQIGIHYGVTDMSNAIGRYSVLDETDGRWKSKAVNATRKKKAFNATYDHKISAGWQVGASYSWVDENYHSKSLKVNPDGTTDDQMINRFRPKNIYRLHLSYDKAAWFVDLSHTIYSGNDTNYFSKSHFGITDLDVNYRLNQDASLYLKIGNLFHQAYESRASASSKVGAFPEPGRNFMLGAKYSF